MALIPNLDQTLCQMQWILPNMRLVLVHSLAETRQCVLLRAVNTVALLEDVVDEVAVDAPTSVAEILAPTHDVVNVIDAPNSSPEAKLEESDLEDVDDIEVLLAAY